MAAFEIGNTSSVASALSRFTVAQLSALQDELEARWGEESPPDAGVREPRRPILPLLDPGVALELPA